jgi:hypothetical protein
MDFLKFHLARPFYALLGSNPRAGQDLARRRHLKNEGVRCRVLTQVGSQKGGLDADPNPLPCLRCDAPIRKAERVLVCTVQISPRLHNVTRRLHNCLQKAVMF